MTRNKTPFFVTEVPLRVNPKEEQILLARLEAGRQLYNAVLGEAQKRVRLVKQSKLFRQARQLPRLIDEEPNLERTKAFRLAWKAQNFDDYALQAYAIEVRKSWLGEHIDADTAQKLGTRAFKAARNLLLGRAKRVRFKSLNQMDTLEGKRPRGPMRWDKEQFVWKGLKLSAYLTSNDPVILHGLNSQVKYVRLVRRKINGKNRFYAQLVNEGKPFRKPKHVVGDDIVGCDIGPSTIAVVSQDTAFLTPFCAEIAERSGEIAILQRQMSRQQRANNPLCFEPSRCDLPKLGQKRGKRKLGKAIKGKRQTNHSRRYLKVRQRKANLERKLAAHRRSLHGKLVNRILSTGKYIHLEKLSYRGWQKMFGRSVGKRAPGMFVTQLKQKAENAGGYVNEFSTQTTKLSQRCICGEVKKKSLSVRVHACSCGVTAQRDLFSAYLARHVDLSGLCQVEQAQCQFSSVDSLLWSAWQQADSLYSQSSIGRPVITSVGAASASAGVMSGTQPHWASSPASEKIDREALSQTNKTPDDVGNHKQLPLFELTESWEKLT